MMPAHKACCEVFAEAAWVFFRKPPSKYEIINNIEEELSEVHLRLAGVTEHLPWQQFIKAYDKPGTLFFLDPPYYKAPY